ncbi:MAG: chromosomal replication initiator protein DnaA [Deltaproteobacteria bacterium]|jgi:chromosomal replication initiator protein|nr:chromosomal replication initiator protein DnaA [Deltaproteobacteria bacterium]NOR11553.1 chromosomal replication initiator protein DnaA [Desulfovibrionaceae bacterium]
MIWQQIKEILSQKLPESAYSLWITPLSCTVENQTLMIGGPDKFFTSWVSDNYRAHINEALQLIGSSNMNVHFIATGKNKSQPLLPPRQEPLRLPNMPKAKSTIRTLHPRYTFDEFMVGESNAFAHSVCESIAANDTSMGSCIYLKAGTGLGKSHLTHAVAHQIINNSPATRLHFLTAQQLTAEMVHHIKDNSMARFKEKYQKHCDVLLLDDIHTLNGRTKTQTELAEAMDVLMESGKRVVFASSLTPQEIPNIETGFRSRLSSGLITSINPPDLYTRIKIIQRKALVNNLSLSDEIVDYLATNIKGDIRQLESAIVSLKAQSSLLQMTPNFTMVKETLSNITIPDRQISSEMIRDLIAVQFKVSVADLKSKSRKKAIAFPRQTAMYLARKYTEGSLADIGKAFNRDHSTVVHAVRTITQKIARNSSIRGQIDYLADKIKKQLL